MTIIVLFAPKQQHFISPCRIIQLPNNAMGLKMPRLCVLAITEAGSVASRAEPRRRETANSRVKFGGGCLRVLSQYRDGMRYEGSETHGTAEKEANEQPHLLPWQRKLFKEQITCIFFGLVFLVCLPSPDGFFVVTWRVLLEAQPVHLVFDLVSRQ